MNFCKLVDKNMFSEKFYVLNRNKFAFFKHKISTTQIKQYLNVSIFIIVKNLIL